MINNQKLQVPSIDATKDKNKLAAHWQNRPGRSTRMSSSSFVAFGRRTPQLTGLQVYNLNYSTALPSTTATALLILPILQTPATVEITTYPTFVRLNDTLPPESGT